MNQYSLTSSEPITMFAAAWERAFVLAPPMSYRMRELYPARWMRIHSLPESKRYPEDETEYAELLTRHNAVATAMFGEGSPVVLVFEEYVDQENAKKHAPMELPGVPRLLRRVGPSEPHPQADPALDGAVDFMALMVIWQRGAFDPMIRAVADDRGPMFLLSTLDAQRVYAPYDGGADLYFESRSARDDWRTRYTAWLSAHPSGL